MIAVMMLAVVVVGESSQSEIDSVQSVISLGYVNITFESLSFSQGAQGTYRATPPPPPQEPSTMVPKFTLGCPEHNLTCSPESHWDALEL